MNKFYKKINSLMRHVRRHIQSGNSVKFIDDEISSILKEGHTITMVHSNGLEDHIPISDLSPNSFENLEEAKEYLQWLHCNFVITKRISIELPPLNSL